MGSGASGWGRCSEEAAVGRWDVTSLVSLAGWSCTQCRLPWLPPEPPLGSGKRTQPRFWREHRLKKWPGLGIRSRSPRPPISSGLGEGNSVLPLPFLLVEPPRGSISRCVCGQAVWEVPRCGPHALAGVTWGCQHTRSFYARASPVSLTLHTGKLRLRSRARVCPPGPQATELGGRGPSGVWSFPLEEPLARVHPQL